MAGWRVPGGIDKPFDNFTRHGLIPVSPNRATTLYKLLALFRCNIELPIDGGAFFRMQVTVDEAAVRTGGDTVAAPQAPELGPEDGAGVTAFPEKDQGVRADDSTVATPGAGILIYLDKIHKYLSKLITGIFR
jgi:hypothetical protein